MADTTNTGLTGAKASIVNPKLASGSIVCPSKSLPPLTRSVYPPPWLAPNATGRLRKLRASSQVPPAGTTGTADALPLSKANTGAMAGFMSRSKVTVNVTSGAIGTNTPRLHATPPTTGLSERC